VAVRKVIVMRANTVLRIVRALLGLGYLAGGLFHLGNVVLGDTRATYEAFAEMAWLGWYQTLISEVIVPLATPFTVAVLLFELAVGALILSRDRTARLGHAGAIVFNLALIPSLATPYWTGNVVLIALHLVCLATRFQTEPERPMPSTGQSPRTRARELTHV
jgi:hypothetical protein